MTSSTPSPSPGYRTHTISTRTIRNAPHLIFGLLVAAILANGLYFWLQKSQIVLNSTYIEYRQEVEKAYELEAKGVYVPQPQLLLDGFYALPGKWILTKLIKDLFCLAAIATALLLWWSRVPKFALPPVSRETMLLALFALMVALGAAVSLVKFGPGVTAMGLRPLAYVVAGLLIAWAAGPHSFELLSRYLVAVLIVEILLGLYEYAYGIPLFNTARLVNRINGTFSYPSSLGIFAVCVCAFAFTYSKIHKGFLLALAAVLVYFTGSATAVLLLAALLGVWAVGKSPAGWRPAIRITSLAVVAAMLLAMPKLVARYDVMDSLWGRVEVVTDYFNHRPGPMGTWFGKGLGIGSNVFNSAVVRSSDISAPEAADRYHARTDSTPMALINQLGVIGTLLFYLLLGAAAWRDRPAAAIYLIMFLAGMTINLLELFPVNFMLGLLLGRSLLFPQDGILRANGG